MAPRSYRAICFDLDGTLLPMDINVFLKRYYGAIQRYAEAAGFDGPSFIETLNAGVRAMATHGDGRSNANAFWEVMARGLNRDAQKLQGELLGFYEGPYCAIGDDVVPNPAAARAIATLKARGYPLLLTTMPLFPRLAVEERLRWAGLNAGDFTRITDYENSTAAKPSPRYYAENVAAAGVEAQDVLMVGNDTGDDLSFARIGADVYLVTDWLIDRQNLGLEGVRSSSMEAFAEWAETLPECARPATAVSDGLIPQAATDEVLVEAGIA